MITLTHLLPFLVSLCLINYASATIWNEGLAIVERDYVSGHQSDTCLLTPLGPGKDDTDNVGSIGTNMSNLIE
jgi:hypothetical protein